MKHLKKKSSSQSLVGIECSRTYLAFLSDCGTVDKTVSHSLGGCENQASPMRIEAEEIGKKVDLALKRTRCLDCEMFHV